MGGPTFEAMREVFEDPSRAMEVLYMSHNDLLDTEAGYRRFSECFNPPTWEDIRLHVFDSIEPGSCGVESTRLKDGSYCDYLNFGDPYIPTLCYVNGEYVVASWGEVVEKLGTWDE